MHRLWVASTAFLLAAVAMGYAVVYRWGPCWFERNAVGPGAVCLSREDDSFVAAAALGGPYAAWSISTWSAYGLLAIGLLLTGIAARRVGLSVAAIVCTLGFLVTSWLPPAATVVAGAMLVAAAAAPLVAGNLVWPLTKPSSRAKAVIFAIALTCCVPVFDYLLAVPLNGGHTSHDAPQMLGAPTTIGAFVASLMLWDLGADERAAREPDDDAPPHQHAITVD